MRLAKFFIPILTGILVTQGICFAQNNKIMVEDYLDMAAIYTQSGNYKKALEYIDMIETILPNDAKIKNQKAQLLKNLNLPQETVATINEANNAEDEPAELSVFENPTKVSPQLDAQENNHSSPTFGTEFYNQKGKEYYLDGNFKQALEYFNKAIEIKSNSAAYNNIGMVFWHQGNYIKAIQHFKKATKTEKGYTKGLLNLSLIYKQQKNDKKRLTTLNEASRINQKDSQVNYFIGQYYIEKKQFKNAIKYFSLSLENNSNALDNYIALASALYEIEDYENAFLVLDKAKLINPTCDKIYYLIAKTSILTGKKEAAIENLQKAIEYNPVASYYYELAKLEFFLGHYENAKQIFKEHFSDAQNAEIYNYLGLCDYRLGDIESALGYLRKAIDYGNKPIYYYNAALCHKSKGNKKLYKTALDEALKFKPQTPQDYIDLSYIYNDLGNAAYAQAVLELGISRYPTNKKLHLAQLKLLEAIGNNEAYIEQKKKNIQMFGN